MNLIKIINKNSDPQTYIIKIHDNLWEFHGALSGEKSLKNITKLGEINEDKFIPNVPYATLDKFGLQSYIQELEDLLKEKPLKPLELNIQWKNNKPNHKFRVRYNPDGKIYSMGKKKNIDSPLYEISIFIQNKFSKYFAYNPDDPMLDPRPEFSPEGFSGRTFSIKEENLKKYIAELQSEVGINRKDGFLEKLKFWK